MSEENDFKYLLDKVHRNKGIDFSLYRPGTLKRRIHTRLKATRSSDYLDYTLYLNRHPEEYDNLVNAVAINVSEFFRNPEAFEAIRKKVIPCILETARGNGLRTIRAWSAGTSFGEEAYSLAILFSEAVAGMNDTQFDVKILGTDIDAECIEAAKRGIYKESSLKGLDKRFKEDFFTASEGKSGIEYIVKPFLKGMTQFKVHNLASGRAPSGLDIILCRNVVIYFTRPLQEFVYSQFAGSLNKGGFLVLGKVEPLSGLAASSFRTVDIRERIYQKI